MPNARGKRRLQIDCAPTTTNPHSLSLLSSYALSLLLMFFSGWILVFVGFYRLGALGGALEG